MICLNQLGNREWVANPMPSDALPQLLFRWRNKYLYFINPACFRIDLDYSVQILTTRYGMCQEPTGCKKNLVLSWDGGTAGPGQCGSDLA